MTGLLVLWDLDYTLADTGGVGRRLYQLTFAEMFGGELPRPGSMAGRTDRAIALEVLTLAGLPEPGRQVRAFEAALAARAPQIADLVREQSRALPGAAAALAALASYAPPADASASPSASVAADSAGPRRADAAADGHRGRYVVQSLLTGNIRELAEVKLGPLGLTGHLDLTVGAYGDTSEVRADLVPVARSRAALVYGRDFGGQATVLVGDTPHDVEAALVTGARAVGVATGSFTAADLAAAGAHAVLADLTDTRQVLAAILAAPGS